MKIPRRAVPHLHRCWLTSDLVEIVRRDVETIPTHLAIDNHSCLESSNSALFDVRLLGRAELRILPAMQRDPERRAFGLAWDKGVHGRVLPDLVMTS